MKNTVKFALPKKNKKQIVKKPYASLSVAQKKVFLKRAANQFSKNFGSTIKALAGE